MELTEQRDGQVQAGCGLVPVRNTTDRHTDQTPHSHYPLNPVEQLVYQLVLHDSGVASCDHFTMGNLFETSKYSIGQLCLMSKLQ